MELGALTLISLLHMGMDFPTTQGIPKLLAEPVKLAGQRRYTQFASQESCFCRTQTLESLSGNRAIRIRTS
eukprot:4515207-Heterocapsa_arctica.AAC.1